MGRTRSAHNGAPNTASCVLFITAMCILPDLRPFLHSAKQPILEGSNRNQTLRRDRRIARIRYGLVARARSRCSRRPVFASTLAPRAVSFVVLVRRPSSTGGSCMEIRGSLKPCAPTFLALAIIIIAGIVVTIASGSGLIPLTVTVQASRRRSMSIPGARACRRSMCLWKKDGKKKEDRV